MKDKTIYYELLRSVEPQDLGAMHFKIIEGQILLKTWEKSRES